MSTVDSCSSDWKNLTCEKCMFKVDRVCRRFPVQPHVQYVIQDDNLETIGYRYQTACAEYAEEQTKLETIWGKVE